MSDVELDNKIRLNQVRREAEKEKKQAKKSIKKKTPIILAKKTKDLVTAPTEIKIVDIFIYGAALALALFKDILDLALVGSLPGIGTIITWCISSAIALILLFDGVSGAKRKLARNLAKKMLVLIAGTMVESFLFGLNFFPFEMATVGIIYWMTLTDRKKENRIKNENQEYD